MRCKKMRANMRRRNPDDRLRDLERAARSSDERLAWNQYIAALERSGQLEIALHSVEDRLHPLGGQVGQEEAEFLMRVLGYQYTLDVLEGVRSSIEDQLGAWDTEEIRNGLRCKEYFTGATKMPAKMEGYFWVKFRPPAWSATMYSPHWFPIRVLTSAEAARRSGKAPRGGIPRIFLMCPICLHEIPTGRLSQHIGSKKCRGS